MAESTPPNTPASPPQQQASAQQPTQPTPPTPPQPAENPQLFAGKYQTPEALSQGYADLRGKLGLQPIEGVAFGNGGMFSSVTALERGYKDMEAMLGRQQPAPASSPAESQATENPLAIPEGQQQPADETVEAVLARAGMKAEDLATTYQQDGKLTEQQYQSLKAAGYPKPVVDAYVQGQVAQGQLRENQQGQIRNQATEMVGGEQQLNTLLQWASSMPDVRKADINRRLGDPSLYAGALTELQAEHSRAVGAGNARPLIEGTHSSTSAAGLPASDRAEFKRIMVAARNGDVAAQRIVANTPDDVLRQMI